MPQAQGGFSRRTALQRVLGLVGMFYLHADNELRDLINGSFNAWICHLCRALEWLSSHLLSEAAVAPDLCRQPGSQAGCSAICAPSPGSLPGFPVWLLSAASAEAEFPLLINAAKDALGSWLSSLERRGIWAPFLTWKIIYTYKLQSLFVSYMVHILVC